MLELGPKSNPANSLPGLGNSGTLLQEVVFKQELTGEPGLEGGTTVCLCVVLHAAGLIPGREKGMCRGPKS